MPEKNLSYHTLGGEQAKQLEFALSKQLNELRSRAVPPGGIVGDLKKDNIKFSHQSQALGRIHRATLRRRNFTVTKMFVNLYNFGIFKSKRQRFHFPVTKIFANLYYFGIF
jgi:hypothetical protein